MKTNSKNENPEAIMKSIIKVLKMIKDKPPDFGIHLALSVFCKVALEARMSVEKVELVLERYLNQYKGYFVEDLSKLSTHFDYPNEN